MARGEAGSAKAIGTAMKAKGLTKLRFYCQVCQKACRDENGYKCHLDSETHMRQIAALGSNAGKAIDNFSKEFQDGYVSLLSRRFGTARVNANKVYQEYIQDRHHLHMNATRWVSLSEFVKHLGREGLVKVEEITDEGQFGWYVTWVDTSPAALARQDALQKMERAKVDEEGRARKLLNQQIRRAQQERQGERARSWEAEEDMQGLRRNGSLTPFKIGLGTSSNTSPAAHPSVREGNRTATGSVSQKLLTAAPLSAPAPFRFASNPLKKKVVTSSSAMAAPQKPDKPTTYGSVFSSSLTKSASPRVHAHGTDTISRSSPTNAAERIMAEERAMREKRQTMGPQPSAKRMRM